jgi:regulator of protease activity HflC (stomatin/prohibitin superfamily)
MAGPTIRESRSWSLPGFLFLVLALGGMLALGAALVQEVQRSQRHMVPPSPAVIVACVLGGFALLLTLRGVFVVNPNEGVVMQLFGRYAGTERREGLRWTNPFYSRHRMSLRVRNFESNKLKVNDLDGNPIEIAAILVWRVGDTAEATFNVDRYADFVQVQAEAGLRQLASQYPYDAHDDHTVALRSSQVEIAERLKHEMNERLQSAGIEVLETRMSHLAYAPEIAQAMLQRQQAGAIIAARQRIVDGAVGMVEMALARLAERGTVQLDEERKAAMVSNLLVVLCGERATQPVINAGTLY